MPQADPTLFELFGGEMETHVPTLTAGLLALEKDPQVPGQIEAVMRAAHSIKGAARIVGQEQIGEIAHVMEDSFTAAGRGQLPVTPPLIDAMLRGVDLMEKLAGGDTAAAAQVPSMLKLLTEHASATSSALPRPQSVRAVRPTPVAAIELPATLDTASCELLRARAAAAGGTVYVDARRVARIEPVGVTLLNTLAQQRELVVINPSPALAAVLAVTQLDQIVRAEVR
jgi:chemotaxis protein histidine kinase CheA